MTCTALAGVHDTAVKVNVYPDEFKPLLKVINRALLTPEGFELTEEEIEMLYGLQHEFADVALNYGA